MDPKSSEIVASDLTTRFVADVRVLPDLLEQVDGRIETFLADPAYDGDPTYSLMINRPQALPLPQVVIPPRRSEGAAAPDDDDLSQRSQHIRNIAAHGRMAWQKSSGYNRRALVDMDQAWRLSSLFGWLDFRWQATPGHRNGANGPQGGDGACVGMDELVMAAAVWDQAAG